MDVFKNPYFKSMNNFILLHKTKAVGNTMPFMDTFLHFRKERQAADGEPYPVPTVKRLARSGTMKARIVPSLHGAGRPSGSEVLPPCVMGKKPSLC